ncbi:MAG: SET domain-containing protein-lysine N-methyltransferase [Candidatus Pacebacteria bacterium]|nr:SET domain-containing protein-lysine N-methyltransferase [Candidatus Paceibacterota bacterium]
MASYTSLKVQLRESEMAGKGLFAIEKINKDEIVADYTNGFGEYVDLKRANEIYDSGLDHMIQIDDDLYFAATNGSESEDSDHINHSCNSNCGIKSPLGVVAMRDIEPGEEITVDYAMIDSSDYGFDCKCGSPDCRGRVTGDDWKIPELQNRYKGYFSDYLQKKIDLLNK